MRYREFEQHIANTLRKDEVSLDIHSLIESIHGKKKKDRKILFFWFKSFSVLGILFISFYLVNGNKIFHDVSSNASVTPINIGNKTIEQSEPKEVLPENQTTAKILESTVSQTAVNDFVKNISKKINKSNTIIHANANNKDEANSVLSNNLHISNESTESAVVNETMNGSLYLPKITSISSIPEPLSKSNININTDKIICPSFSNKSKLFLQLIPELGVFMPLKTLENVSGESNNIFTLRNQGEKSLEGLQAALYLRLRKGKSPFYVQGGLSYSRLTEKMKLNYSYTKKDTTQGIISITVSQTGDTITTIYGDIVKEKTISGSKIAHHTFSLLDVPLAVGYEKKFNEWVLGIEAGVMLNISSSAAGKILASDTSFTSINIPANNFRTSLGLSYFAGFTIGKDFNNIGRIYLALRGRVLPSSFSGDQNRIKQTYQFAGLNVGYIYTF
ncbi:MAG: hypothetical protein IPO92_03390 [Saprospiraceae bacterium]|nr:hypothetical protein [Saprospiraceae bacterium]